MEPETDAITHLREISTSLETVKRQCTSFLQRPKNHKGPNGAVKAVRTVVDASDRNLRALEDVVAQGTSVAAEKQPTAESVAKNDIPGATTTPAISMSKPEPDAVQGHASSAIPNGFMTDSLFSSLPVSEPTKRALRDTFGYSRMTEVQKASLPVGLKGADVLAKAKTGTGKTLAFLIPAIEKVAKVPIRHGIGCLVVAPTRELAQQIYEEAVKLTSTHTNFRVTCVVGGTNIAQDRRRLAKGTDILVATPGRCKDHLENSPGFKEKFQKAPNGDGLSVLVLDEADRMLDMGFQPDIKTILTYLPEDRQTLLYSATVTKELQEVVHLAFTQETHNFVNCTGDDNEVHDHVDQNWVVTPLHEQLSTVAKYLGTQMKNPNFKVMVFFATARHCGFVADLFQAAGIKNVLQIHSRMSQPKRTKVSEVFRGSSGGHILFSSDVSARGVDYPGVTAVLQVGLTSREQYIHRLGRTARAGANGKGMLLLSPFEQTVHKELNDLLPPKPVPISSISFNGGAEVERKVKMTLNNVERNAELRDSANKAYVAWLGMYNSASKYTRWSKQELVRQAAEFAKCIGLSKVPPMQPKTIGKMGLRGVPGLNVERPSSNSHNKRSAGAH